MPPYITAFIFSLTLCLVRSCKIHIMERLFMSRNKLLGSLNVRLSNIHAIFAFAGTDRAKLCIQRYHRV